MVGSDEVTAIYAGLDLVYSGGTTPPIQPQYRTLTTATTCVGVDKYELDEYQVSLDGGLTWETTGTSATTLIEADSVDCGYVLDAFNAYDENGQLLTSTGCNRIEEVLGGELIQDIVTGDFEVDAGNIWSVEIPDCVTSIGNNAFNLCISLASVTIPDSVISIGSSAFRACNSLTSITIGNSVESIGENAFQDCNSLTSIYIPNNVTHIDDEAFMGCDSLESVTILSYNPYGVFLGTDAFGDVTSNFPIIYVLSEYLEDWKMAHPNYDNRFEAIPL